MQGLVPALKQQALLWVDHTRLRRRDAEEAVVEALGLLKKPTVLQPLHHLRWRGRKAFGLAPA